MLRVVECFPCRHEWRVDLRREVCDACARRCVVIYVSPPAAREWRGADGVAWQGCTKCVAKREAAAAEADEPVLQAAG